MSELGNQPQPYRPPANHPDGTKRCAACHTPLLMAPLGATAGLCPGFACIQPDVITAGRLRDFNAVMRMVLIGRMKAEVEPETGITWLRQPPLKAPPKPIEIRLDSGELRYRDWDVTAIDRYVPEGRDDGTD